MLDPQNASVLQNVSNAAVWGSLAASFFLSSFLVVQGLVNRENRSRLITFAAVNFFIALNDLSHPYLAFYDYERIRIVLWSIYAGVLLWVLHFPRRASISAIAGLFAAACAAWIFWKPELGTSMVVGPTAYIAAVAHGLDFKRRHCYASCVLCGCSLALGMLSTFYYLFILSGDQSLIVTGYAHYAALSITALVFGWVYFPREMSGRAPVRVSSKLAIAYVGCIAFGQCIVLISLLILKPWSISGYISGSLVIFGATLLLFFYHRQQLVIYTENVTMLLDQRTASLQKAQQELASRNEHQAQLLEEQFKEIHEKNDVIERQRRLELAAQTAGQAAHDIRNLLWPIDLQLTLLQRRYAVHPGQELIQGVKHQFTRLQELTNQMLALSRRGQLQFQPVLLNDLLRDVSLDTAEVPIRIEWESEAWVSGSGAQLVRAVANLVTNAIDATDRKPNQVTLSCGTVQIFEERCCHMGFLKPGKYSFVRIADTGPGIPPEVIDRIFEPFFSTKTATTSSGSGLGLSIVSAVVSDHKGILDIETSSSGTIFSIYLPFQDAPQHSAGDAKIAGGGLIFVIDDDQIMQQMCHEVLKPHGYVVASATTVKESQRFLQKNQPDLILLDLHLPDGSGEEVLKSLTTRASRSRILVFSAYLSTPECERLASLGASRFAYKPVGASTLLSAVQEAMSDIQRISLQSQDVSNI